MSPDRFLSTVINPPLAMLEGMSRIKISRWALTNMLAIALQESLCKYRYQLLSGGRPGAAKGFWQFEEGGGVAGVMAHARTRDLARQICDIESVSWRKDAVWRALEGNDMVATVFARLLLWSDPRALPENANDGWECYLRNWRPGKPHKNKWRANWNEANKVVSRFLGENQ